MKIRYFKWVLLRFSDAHVRVCVWPLIELIYEEINFMSTQNVKRPSTQQRQWSEINLLYCNAGGMSFSFLLRTWVFQVALLSCSDLVAVFTRKIINATIDYIFIWQHYTFSIFVSNLDTKCQKQQIATTIKVATVFLTSKASLHCCCCISIGRKKKNFLITKFEC